jgi:hypothetical protein
MAVGDDLGLLLRRDRLDAPERHRSQVVNNDDVITTC